MQSLNRWCRRLRVSEKMNWNCKYMRKMKKNKIFPIAVNKTGSRFLLDIKSVAVNTFRRGTICSMNYGEGAFIWWYLLWDGDYYAARRAKEKMFAVTIMRKLKKLVF